MKSLILRILLLFLTISSLFTGCNYNRIKNAGTGENDASHSKESILAAGLDYNTISRAIIGPKCLSCHSASGGNQGGLSLDNYSQVKSSLNKIYFRSIEQKDMPPSTALSALEEDALKTWIELGAPERNLGKGNGREIKGPITWMTVRERIFRVSCLDCHSGKSPDGHLDLEKLETVRSNIDKIFRSAIVEVSMPLDPYPAMSQAEKQALMKWISQGMPE